MTPIQRSAGLGVGAVLALVLAGCSSATTDSQTTAEPSQEPVASQSASPSASAAATSPDKPAPSPAKAEAGPGAQISYADYQKDKAEYADTEVVLFFTAPWCSSCLATHRSLEETGVPTGLTVVDVDYDSATDLRQEYGVTTQHTFVQVNGNGKELKKFSGSISGEDIQSQLA